MNGSLAGLAAITPGSGFVSPQASIIIGLLGSSGSFFGASIVRERFGLDDVLDVFALQGIPGIIGTLLSGFFGTGVEKPATAASAGHGVFYGGGANLLGAQVIGAVITVVWSSICTYGIFHAIARLSGIDITPKMEEEGLDMCQIGEHAYDLDEHGISQYVHSYGNSADAIAKLCDAASEGKLTQLEVMVRSGIDPSQGDYDCRTPLHLAAAEGHIDIIKFLCMHHKVDVAAQDRWGMTPLLDALVNGHRLAANVLLSFKATADEQKLALRLCLAASRGDINLLRRACACAALDTMYGSTEEDMLNLPRLADYDGRTPLHLAAAAGYADCCQVLVEHGANPKRKDRWGVTPEDEAKGDSRVALALDGKLGESTRSPSETSSTVPLLKSMSKVSASSSNKVQPSSSRKSGASCGVAARELCAASRLGDYEEVKRLLKKGSSCEYRDYDGRSALHLAASEGHVHLVKTLIDVHGAAVGKEDALGNTPLLEAMLGGHGLAVAALSRRGAALNEEQSHRLGIVFCAAAFRNDVATMERLCSSGADVDTSDYDSRTALHIASSEGNASLVKWLLLRGASPACIDRFGNSPCQDAARHGHASIEAIFQEKALAANNNTTNV